MIAFLVCLSQLCASAGDGNVRECLSFPGGTCLTEACADWRDAECGGGSRCVCGAGKCSGVDEACYSKENKEIAGVYQFRNARYPGHYLSCDWSGGVAAVTDSKASGTFWTLVEPPGQQEGLMSYLVYSQEWPDSVMTVSATSNSKGMTLSLGCSRITGALGGMSEDLDIGILNLFFNLPPAEIENPGNQSMIMMQAHRKGNNELYVYVYEYLGGQHSGVIQGDKGAGSYWYVEPSLPDSVMSKLPAFTGTKCSYDCGKVATRTSMAACARATLLASAMAVLAVLAQA